MRVAIFLLLIWVGAGVIAQDLQSMQFAQNLGLILASESECGLSYSDAAIQALIDERVRPDDLAFASTLQLMTSGAEYQLADMTEAQKVANCRAVENSARHFGFID